MQFDLENARAPEVWNPAECEDLLDAIVLEARENLEKLAQGLVELERASEKPETVDPLFRAAHNLKGLAKVLTVDKMHVLSQAMECILDDLREKRRKATPEIVDLLLEMTDILRDRVLSEVADKKPISTDISPVLEKFLSLPPATAGPTSQETAPPCAAPPPSPTAASPPDKPPHPVPSDRPLRPLDGLAEPRTVETSAPAAPAALKASDQTLRVPLEKLDNIMNLVGEAVINRIRLEQRITEFIGLGETLDRNAKKLREILSSREKKGVNEKLLKALEDLVLNLCSIGDPGDSASLLREELPGILKECGPLDGRKEEATSFQTVSEELDRLRRVFEEVGDRVRESTEQVRHITTALQESVMKVRMVPIEQLFSRFPRMVRDICRSLDKNARLEIKGEDTELDKMLIQSVEEPLMHLLRNSLDHGVESAEERERAGKAPEGLVSLGAYHKGNQVYIEVEDDGRGIDIEKVRRAAIRKRFITDEEAARIGDEDLLNFLFTSGFSTAATVSDISGRGVGLDVVRNNIARLKGTVHVTSIPGKGTKFQIRLPLTLSIINVLLVSKNNETFAIPLSHVLEMVLIGSDDIRKIGVKEVVNLRGQALPLLRLDEVLNLCGEAWETGERMPVVVVGTSERPLGIIIDKFVGKQEVVIKSLGELLTRVRYALGTTILGDGRVIPILDIHTIVESASVVRRVAVPGGEAEERKAEEATPATEGMRIRILLVEDSPTMRQRLRSILTGAGYAVTEAEDGVQALEIAERESFDLVSTDIMMPRMDGYELTRRLRTLPKYRSVPIVIVTAKVERMDRVRGFDVGADDYVTKPFDRESLLTVVRNNLRL